MNKSTNNYRRCDYCAHQNEKKQCCCQNRQSVHSIKTKVNSRGKNRNRNVKKSNIQSSAISYINTTLPITNNPVLPHFSSNILAQNSILRTQNDYLKRQLHSQHYVSAFTKDDRNISTLQSSENDTSRTYKLHDKLYIANRNLQQVLIQLDNVSKSNKQLHQLNTKISSEKQQLRIANEELYEECQKLKKKNKKLNKIVQSLPNQSDLHKIMQINSQLERDNSGLRNQIQDLKEEIRKINNLNRTVVEIENLSPQWVAHTSNKINLLQKNISKLEEQNKQNTFVSQNCSFISRQPDQQLTGIKNQLISAIKLLRAQSSSIKFGSTYNELFGNINGNCTVMLLIKSLCQALLEPMNQLYFQYQKTTEKAIKVYENKLEKIVRRMENMMIKVSNERLREQGKGKYFF